MRIIICKHIHARVFVISNDLLIVSPPISLIRMTSVQVIPKFGHGKSMLRRSRNLRILCPAYVASQPNGFRDQTTLLQP